MHSLSKSKLIAYRQCPKRLWLELHKPELRDDSGSQAVFATGHTVGEIAQRVFNPDGNGLNVDPHILGWEAAREQSALLLDEGNRPIFEALLSIPGAIALADVLLPDTGTESQRWQMIEVKASASVKDYHRDDIAIQTYIADESGIPLSRSGLAHIDTSFVYEGDGNYQGLFHVEDLTGEARSRRSEVATWLEEAQRIAQMETPPEIEVGDQCSQPFACAFCNHCWKDVVQAEDPFGMLPHFGAKKREHLEAQEIDRLEDVPEDLLSGKQRLVQAAHVAGEVYFNEAYAREQLRSYTGPSYFLDFETIKFAVPVWKGTRPYQNLPFQYSLHRVDSDGTLHHREFLDLTDGDPRRALAEQMIAECGEEGAIYVYNAGFERRILADLAAFYSDLAPSLEALMNRIVDLLPIARDCYYNPLQNGSWSLKAVAPAIAPELSYGELEGVQVGSDAEIAYREACDPETTPERREALRNQLLEYCKLDTLATVRIWQFFKSSNTINL